MDLFGGYLVENGIISKSQLLKALIVKVEQVPPSGKVILENRWLEDENLKRILDLQWEKGIDFFSACEELKLDLSLNDLRDKVGAVQRDSTQPIGQILVEHCDVPFSLVSEALVDFCSKDISEISSHSGAIDPKEPRFWTISDKNRQSYIDLLSEEIRDELLLYVRELSEAPFITDSDKQKELFLSIIELLKRLLAASNFIRAEISALLLDKLLYSIVFYSKSGSEIDTERANELASFMKKTIKILWELKTFINISGSEKGFWENKVAKSNFKMLTTQLEELIESPQG